MYIELKSTIDVASSPGHTHFSMLHAEKRGTGKWVWPGDEATPNVGDSDAQFLVVGDCVRACPHF